MTLLEQLLVITLLMLFTTLAFVSGAPLVDAVALRGATDEAVELFFLAREEALVTGRRTAIRFDGRQGRIVLHRGRDTVARADLASRGVRIWSSRDSTAYGPDGVGVGAANLTLVLARGRWRDTLTVSRLGRVAR